MFSDINNFMSKLGNAKYSDELIGITNNILKEKRMYTIYGKGNCPNCENAKKLLESKNIEFEYVTINAASEEVKLLENMAGKSIKSVPQILHSDNGFFRYVGGLKELMEDIKNA